MTGAGVWARISALLDLGRSQEARAELGRALASTPDDADLWRVLSHVQGSLGEHTAALDSARRAAALEPDSSDAQRTLGTALWNADVVGRPLLQFRWPRLLSGQRITGPALAAMQQSLRLDPYAADTHVVLAGMYLTMNKTDLAGTHYAAALQQEPHNPAARLGLGQLALRRKQAAEAEQHAREVLAQDPQSVRALELLARAQLRQRQPDQAFRSALAAVKLDPASTYAQMQFRALVDGYLPDALTHSVTLDAGRIVIRNWYRLARLSPEVRAQILSVQRAPRPGAKRAFGLPPVFRFVFLGLVFLRAILSAMLPADQRRELDGVVLTLLAAVVLGLVAWKLLERLRRRRS